MVIAVRDLKASIAQYRQAYALSEPHGAAKDASFGARLAWFRGTPVVLAEPSDAQSWVARRILQFGDGPCAFVLGKREDGAPRRATYQTDGEVPLGSTMPDFLVFDSARLGYGTWASRIELRLQADTKSESRP